MRATFAARHRHLLHIEQVAHPGGELYPPGQPLLARAQVYLPKSILPALAYYFKANEAAFAGATKAVL